MRNAKETIDFLLLYSLEYKLDFHNNESNAVNKQANNFSIQ